MATTREKRNYNTNIAAKCSICRDTKIFDGMTCACTGEITAKGLY